MIPKSFHKKLYLGPEEPRNKLPVPNTEDNIDPVIKKDIKYILEKNLQEIIASYGSYVDCLREIIEEKEVSPKALRTYLLTLSAFRESSGNQMLTLMSDKKSELQKAETILDVFDFLITECASFLNCDIFERIIKRYKIDVEREKYEELQYPELLVAYIRKHQISEFVKINPLLKSKIGTKELIVKYDIESTCRLAKVKDLEKFIADMFDLLPSALEIVDIKDGCIIVTFLIPASVAEVLFTSVTTFSSDQEDQLKCAEVLWLKCNGYTFHFSKGKVTRNPGIS